MNDGLIKGLNSIIILCDSFLEQLNESVTDLADNRIDIPNFDTINTKRGMYDNYRIVAVRNDEISKLLVKCHKLDIDIKDVLNSLKIHNELPQSIARNYVDRLSSLKSQIYDYRNLLQVEKDNADALLRLMNSAQYIVGSPRLLGVE